MPLDPQARALLEQLTAQAAPPVTVLSPAESRREMEEATRSLGPPVRVARVEDRTIPGSGGPIPIRITMPEGSGPFPALVYFHGGGWVLGSIATHDGICRSLTNGAGVAVVSVNYRLAPEHSFPAAADDAFAATAWVAAHGGALDIDPGRLAVGGDSAGGNLAAVVALMARDRGEPRLAFQLLVYPITNDDLDTPSYRENAEGYFLTREAMAWYWDQYAPNPRDRRNPYASPLRAPDLSRLPPALVITAEYDPLRDEAEAYALRLTEAGVATRRIRYPGMIHGFLRRAAVLDQGKNALNECAAALRAALENR
jgi:acetyl esterase